jgi:sugar lactone lactonase YvrE
MRELGFFTAAAFQGSAGAKRSECSMGKETKVILEGLIFPECPRWHDGKVWFSDMLDLKIIAVDPGGHAVIAAEVPGQPGGLGFLPDGRLLVVSMTDQRLLRLDAGGLKEVADLSRMAKGNCNDMVVDVQGRAYIGDWGFVGPPKKGQVMKADLILVTPDGKARIVSDELLFPNGAVITPDNQILIVAESSASRLAAFDIEDDGSLANYRVWANLGKGVIPDGICLDAEGAIWVTDSAGKDVIRVRKGGEVAERITVSDRAYACILGGPERRDLYLTTAAPGLFADLKDKRSGKIEVIKVDVPGAGLP